MAEVEVRILATNDTEAGVQQAESSIKRLTDGSAEGFTEATRRSDGFSRGLRDMDRAGEPAVRRARSLRAELRDLAHATVAGDRGFHAWGGSLRLAAASFAGFAAAAAVTTLPGALAGLAQKGAESTESVNRLGRRMSLSAEETAQLEREIAILVATEGEGVVSTKEAVEAFSLLRDRGEGTAGSLRILGEAIKLASVTGADLKETTTGLDGTLGAWGLTAGEAGRVGDLLLGTWKATGEAVPAMTGSLTANAQTMQSLGFTVDSALGSMNTLTSQGLVALLPKLAELQDQNSDTAKAVDALGVSLFNADGTARSVTSVLDELGNSSGVQNDRLKLFGEEGAAALQRLKSPGDEVRASIDAQKESVGNLDRTFQEFARDSPAAMERWKNQLVNAADGAAASVIGIVGAVDTAQRAWAEFDSAAASRLRDFIGGVGASVGPQASVASPTVGGPTVLPGFQLQEPTFRPGGIGAIDGSTTPPASTSDPSSNPILILLRALGLVPFADGGIVTGPTAALIGERGPEAVIPLDQIRGLLGPRVVIQSVTVQDGQGFDRLLRSYGVNRRGI